MASVSFLTSLTDLCVLLGFIDKGTDAERC